MNTPTEVFVNTIRDTTHGSDWYGLCEVCKQDVSRTSHLQKQRVWVKESGIRYLSPVGGGAYGHAGCLLTVFGDALAKSQFPRVDGLPTVTDEQFAAIDAAKEQ